MTFLVGYGWDMQPVPDEQRTIARAKQGDEEAVTLLYERYVDLIFAYISYRVESAEVAEDLTSEVFLRMVRSLGSYTDRGLPFRAWLFRIAANLITDHYRHKNKYPVTPIHDHFESDDPNPFEQVVEDQEQLDMQLALKTLPTQYQDLLLLHFVEDLPYEEIVKIMNKSAAALRAMQYRALKSLAQQLEKLHRSRSAIWGDEQ
jgi:RNA polymerase sigma-70 factor (ECF subfamily)